MAWRYPRPVCKNVRPSSNRRLPQSRSSRVRQVVWRLARMPTIGAVVDGSSSVRKADLPCDNADPRCLVKRSERGWTSWVTIEGGLKTVPVSGRGCAVAGSSRTSGANPDRGSRGSTCSRNQATVHRPVEHLVKRNSGLQDRDVGAGLAGLAIRPRGIGCGSRTQHCGRESRRSSPR